LRPAPRDARVLRGSLLFKGMSDRDGEPKKREDHYGDSGETLHTDMQPASYPVRLLSSRAKKPLIEWFDFDFST